MRYHIYLQEPALHIIDATADSATYEIVYENQYNQHLDFVLRHVDGLEHLRVARDRILYIAVDDD